VSLQQILREHRHSLAECPRGGQCPVCYELDLAQFAANDTLHFITDDQLLFELQRREYTAAHKAKLEAEAARRKAKP
jgi:hypothetical protein